MTQPPPPPRLLSRAAAFLLGFFVLLLLVSYRYLLPAYRIWHDVHADDRARKHLAIISSLVLLLVLFFLFTLLVLIFKPSRWFLPRKPPARTKTHYTDAWKESADRMPTPPPDEIE
jgi:archaellum biogenesis protein FlaJ (TadC family)